MRVETPDRGAVAEPLPSEALGRRVSCDGERATVRYVGVVPPTAGLWLGVEWDDPKRGKHDGSHEGVRYFTCRFPTGGSFVRPKKASFGMSYVAALRQRYEGDVGCVDGEKLKISTRTVEMVGFEDLSKKKKIENLTSVSLRGCEVNGPGPENEVRQTTPNVVSLNLSGNLLCCWEDVASITKQLEGLQELQLSDNRLCIPADPQNLAHAFINLRVLALNSTAVIWSEVLRCAPMWPLLEELYVCENEITELHRPKNVLQNLKVLDLSKNSLAGGNELLNIAELPRLEKLNLSSTGLSTLQFNDVGHSSIMHCKRPLTLPHVVPSLEKLASLQQLSCHRNPLIEQDRTPETTRQLFIARIGQLQVLNKSEVMREERKGAELDYCKMFCVMWLGSGGNRDPELDRPSGEFVEQHPRFQSLIRKYGAPEEGELKKTTFALKNQLLSKFLMTNLLCGVCSRSMLDSMTVQKVKGLLYRLLKVSDSELKLTYTSSKVKIEMNNDLQPLAFYSIEDGDTVLVRCL
uniref:Tubulin-specific chaperone E n=1 Tax=Scleropages formosus TaxID=113540 RepID=A0A8C9V8T3_SCLFO